MSNSPYLPPSDDGPRALKMLELLVDTQRDTNRLLTALLQRQESHLKHQNEQKKHCDEWKKDNKELSKRCTVATNRGNDILTHLVDAMVTELETMEDVDTDYGDHFQVFEFVDKYGPRFQQFGAMLQVIAQLGTPQ